MKSDEQLRADVAEELRADPLVEAGAIEVAVREGVATLAGRVARAAERTLAERAAHRVAGVRSVVNAIEVDADDGHAATDDELADAAAHALAWDLWVPRHGVQVEARAGWITLRGEVDSWYQKEAAVRDVSRIPGVHGVTDALTIRATPAPAEVGERIGQALGRADVSATIRVETFPGAVLLRGVVRTGAEREDAERAARSAPGVLEVCNGLEVRGPEPLGISA